MTIQNTYHAYGMIAPYLKGLQVGHIVPHQADVNIHHQEAGLALLAKQSENLLPFEFLANKQTLVIQSSEKENLDETVNRFDCSMDAVICFESSVWQNHQEILFREAKRLLKPHGIFILWMKNNVSVKMAKTQTHFDRDHFDQTLKKSFRETHWLRHKRLSHSAIWPEGNNSLFVSITDIQQENVFSERHLRDDAGHYLVIAHTAKEPRPALGRLLSSMNILADITQETALPELETGLQYRRLLQVQTGELQETHEMLRQAEDECEQLNKENKTYQVQISQLVKDFAEVQQQLKINRVDVNYLMNLRQQVKEYRAYQQQHQHSIEQEKLVSVPRLPLAKAFGLQRWLTKTTRPNMKNN